jgi:hypothetical protein
VTGRDAWTSYIVAALFVNFVRRFHVIAADGSLGFWNICVCVVHRPFIFNDALDIDRRLLLAMQKIASQRNNCASIPRRYYGVQDVRPRGR